MSITQNDLEQLKQEFQAHLGKMADEYPSDFAAFLHLRMAEQLLTVVQSSHSLLKTVEALAKKVGD